MGSIDTAVGSVSLCNSLNRTGVAKIIYDKRIVVVQILECYNPLPSVPHV